MMDRGKSEFFFNLTSARRARVNKIYLMTSARRSRSCSQHHWYGITDLSNISAALQQYLHNLSNDDNSEISLRNSVIFTTTTVLHKECAPFGFDSESWKISEEFTKIANFKHASDGVINELINLMKKLDLAISNEGNCFSSLVLGVVSSSLVLSVVFLHSF